MRQQNGTIYALYRQRFASRPETYHLRHNAGATLASLDGRRWHVPGETALSARTAVRAETAGDGSGVRSWRHAEVDLVDAKQTESETGEQCLRRRKLPGPCPTVRLTPA